MVQITSVAPMLLVADVFETAEYYRDVLGFGFDKIEGNPPSFVIISRDGKRLMFRQPRNVASLPSNATVIPDFADVFLHVDDVEALAEELRSRGAEIVDGPTYRAIWNGKELAVRDCNGRVLASASRWTDPNAFRPFVRRELSIFVARQRVEERLVGFQAGWRPRRQFVLQRLETLSQRQLGRLRVRRPRLLVGARVRHAPMLPGSILNPGPMVDERLIRFT
jgi:catechol 2,3-dioxygenase-like lactoylglutathione lyase family enzyme